MVHEQAFKLPGGIWLSTGSIVSVISNCIFYFNFSALTIAPAYPSTQVIQIQNNFLLFVVFFIHQSTVSLLHQIESYTLKVTLSTIKLHFKFDVSEKHFFQKFGNC